MALPEFVSQQGGRQGRAAANDIALLVGAARSGTTLLRLILDAHPEVGCPPEAGMPSLIQNLGRVWWTIDADRAHERVQDPQVANPAGLDLGGEDGGDERKGMLPPLPPNAKAEVRRAALAPIRHYCEVEGKRVYCDKSLDSVYHLEAVRQIFPGAKYVLLFRHVMDTVASGLEASPWGFQAFGYLPFVQRSPENFVSALVGYWLTHVTNPDRAVRLAPPG